MQAEEEAAAEAAAKEAEELAAAPVNRVRKLASSGASPKDILDELNTIDAEGGQIGRTRILYEVRRQRRRFACGQNCHWLWSWGFQPCDKQETPGWDTPVCQLLSCA